MLVIIDSTGTASDYGPEGWATLPDPNDPAFAKTAAEISDHQAQVELELALAAEQEQLRRAGSEAIHQSNAA